MATAAKIAYPHIEKTPDVRGGKACITGTRIAVKDIVILHKQGTPIEQMLTHYSSRPLTPAEVYAALAYYYDHRDEIEAEFADEERFYAEADRRWEELVARHGGHPPENPTPEERAIPRPFPWPPKR
jgi:uncharacterized protein (DUF433 family)